MGGMGPMDQSVPRLADFGRGFRSDGWGQNSNCMTMRKGGGIEEGKNGGGEEEGRGKENERVG